MARSYSLIAANTWVVKLGGSLAESSHLPLWLEALAETDAIIVPGGGPFADAVRKAQAHWRFDDKTAHHMAILGMRQYGRMLVGLCPKLLAAATVEELRDSPGRSRVWLPLPEELDAAGIPATWDITSDSLAAWVAGCLNASNLLLVKSGITSLGAMLSLPPDEVGINALRVISCEQLVNQQWVDTVFMDYGARGPFQSWLCGSDGHLDLTESLSDPVRHLTQIIWK
jgi:aspartokinase-like uncharacterized kinase